MRGGRKRWALPLPQRGPLLLWRARPQRRDHGMSTSPGFRELGYTSGILLLSGELPPLTKTKLGLSFHMNLGGHLNFAPVSSFLCVNWSSSVGKAITSPDTAAHGHFPNDSGGELLFVLQIMWSQVITFTLEEIFFPLLCVKLLS